MKVVQALSVAAPAAERELDALLRARWEATPFRRPRDRVLLRAAVLARSEDFVHDDPVLRDFVCSGLVVEMVSELLSNPDEAARLGRAGQNLLEENRGALERLLVLLEPLLASNSST